MELCRSAVHSLASENLRDHNYLFLKPFDFKDTPGYEMEVDRVMDLETLSQNLENNEYSDPNGFFEDAGLIFKNAIVYHGLHGSKWVVELAEYMLKRCEEEELGAGGKTLGNGKKRTQRSPSGSVLDKVGGKKQEGGSVGGAVARSPKGSILSNKRKKPPDITSTVTTKNKATPALSIPTLTLPLDGNYETWEAFVDKKGYDISLSQAKIIKTWVKHLDPRWIADQVKFFNVIRRMRSQLKPSARDAWASVLPARQSSNFDFCALILMVATPNVLDTQIIDVFGPLFSNQHVDAQWIITTGEVRLREIFKPLGRQNESAKYVTAIARSWTGMPRNYRVLVEQFKGVGPKVALVAINECFALAQGVPCDIHMVRIFAVLGWMPAPSSCLECWERRKSEIGMYEFARAAIEGWFPPDLWGELNQTWAGLGQIFGNAQATTEMAEWIDKEQLSHTTDFRQSDADKLTLIHGVYGRKSKKGSTK